MKLKVRSHVESHHWSLSLLDSPLSTVLAESSLFMKQSDSSVAHRFGLGKRGQPLYPGSLGPVEFDGCLSIL